MTGMVKSIYSFDVLGKEYAELLCSHVSFVLKRCLEVLLISQRDLRAGTVLRENAEL